MKRFNYYLLVAIAAFAFISSCKNINYKKTRSGLIYKIFPAGGNGQLMKNGNVVKYNVIYKINDSVLYTSYGKAPSFDNVRDSDPTAYNITELFTRMKKGDSAVTIQMFDSLIKRGAQIPFPVKKGDRLITQVKVIDVFANDSLARPDFLAEMEKDKPRQMKEQEERNAKQAEEQAKMDAEQIKQQYKDAEEAERSGEAAKELKEMEAYLAKKNLKAEKVGKGTYVTIQQQGTGPLAEDGKYVNVKYTGKVLSTDSVFQSSSFTFRLGKQPLIIGWAEGMRVLRQGAKATLYIPGYVAYGKNPGPAGKPFAALIFDVEILGVSDNPTDQQATQPQK
jgi:FKBP-type peptidyl-prolyl cis-trans isomerase